MKKKLTVLVCVILALALAACGSKTPETAAPAETVPVQTTEAATMPSETTQPTEAETLPLPAEDLIIETAYGDLHFPGDWASFLKVEFSENPYTVTFYAVLDDRPEPQRLYALSFNARSLEPTAALKTDSGYVPVAVTYESLITDATWSQEDVTIVYSMMESLNHIMVNLPLEDPAVLKTPTETTPPATTPSTSGSQDNTQTDPVPTVPVQNPDAMAVDTPYMALYYPDMWEEYLDIQVTKGTPYVVSYNCKIGTHKSLHLFSIRFGGTKGTLLKTIKADDGKMVEIRVDVPELKMDSSWSAEEQTIAYAMQEDLNYLLGKMNG